MKQRTDLTKAQCEALLVSEYYGHLGCCDADEPYVLPLTYVYKDAVIFSYTREGKKIDMMRENPLVCVQVEEVKMPAGWQSVIAWGTFEEITDADEIRKAKALLADEFAKLWMQYKQVSIVSPLVTDLQELKDGKLPVIYRIKVQKITGKEQRYA